MGGGNEEERQETICATFFVPTLPGASAPAICGLGKAVLLGAGGLYVGAKCDFCGHDLDPCMVWLLCLLPEELWS